MNALFFTKYLRISKKCSTFAPAFEKQQLIAKFLANKLPAIFATVAQLVEQRIRNAWVGGSSPPSGSEKKVSAFFFLYRIDEELLLSVKHRDTDNQQYKNDASAIG